MKAFIFVALVASVAARGLDFETLRLVKEKSLLNRPVVEDLLLKEKLAQRIPLQKTVVGDAVLDRVLPVERELVRGQDLIRDQDLVRGQDLIRDQELFRGQDLIRDQERVQGQDIVRDIYNVDRVYTFEELYNTELFREYLTIPLFRQYIQYPTFQRYVASVYFQRFWQIPTFRQYFLNPVLFYKYIYPIVQLFQTEYTLPTQQEQVIRGQDLTYGQDVYGRQTLEDLIYKNRNVFPYVYGQQDVYNRLNTYGLPTYTRQYPYTTTTTQGVNYKFLLDKIYRNLLVNKPVVEDVQVKTDVKILPVEKKVIVEPITGERQVVVEEPKIVDVKVDEKIVPVERITPVQQVLPVERRQVVDTVLDRDQIYRDQMVREALLKDLIKEKYITPEMYEQIRDIPTIRREGRQMYDITTPYVTRREQNIYTPYNRFVQQGERVNLYNNLYNKLYNTEIPTIQENTVYDRLPLQQLLGNIVA